MKAMDVDAVRAFLLAADLQSFTRAAEVLGTTQSAVSIKLRRLEEQLGRRLLERTPRQVRLSAEGLAFLGVARELVSSHDRAATAFETEPRRLAIGINQQLVGSQLPSLLRQMRNHDPHLLVEMRIAGTNELMQGLDQGELDAVLVLRPEDRGKRGKAAFAESFSWFAAAGWEPHAGQPLPLATQGESCRVRIEAVRALDRAGIEWREVFVGRGAAILGAAAVAGLAVAVLARRAAPPGTIDVGALLSLPPIRPQDVMLYSNLSDRRTRDALRILALAFQ
ncbi:MULTISPECIES: LysR family transcriptional regulator [unclassified Lysobacter]|uniref:LysR family transcriptional regulator n=1 Tax=unclassified Lysobacter TaxID=2635362 RepID=UPI0006FD1A6A|nr:MULTISPECIES: LysR family transcriptional regulator [unclassified Lysobacter]KRA20957.1 LysR family transcriptional regulator [Lysobacter sp. Root604]KRD39963.1 LysR family transcriptional regulator [Lysobacter sp. Root916]